MTLLCHIIKRTQYYYIGSPETAKRFESTKYKCIYHHRIDSTHREIYDLDRGNRELYLYQDRPLIVGTKRESNNVYVRD